MPVALLCQHHAQLLLFIIGGRFKYCIADTVFEQDPFHRVTTRGNAVTTAEVDGKPITIGLNAYSRSDAIEACAVDL